MIGNDIVDIEEARVRSNWQRPRFLTKLFTIKEQNYIQNSRTPFLMVWYLWTMKEAAYKLFTQLYKGRFYNPRGFECFVDAASGIVRYKDFQCETKTQITEDFIISEARLKPDHFSSKVIVFETNNSKVQSNYLKKQVLSYFKVLHPNSDKLQLEYSEFGVPTIQTNSGSHYFSLTHHGRFGAYAIA
jgi:phosphopantetheinyl transferase